MATDTERLRWLMGALALDGLAGEDLHAFADDVAREAGREEPTDDDEFEGFRRLIDWTIADESKGPTDGS